MRSLTEDLPLRMTTVWNAFRAVAVIPHRYGPARGSLVQYDDRRVRFVWADHASAQVAEVTVDDQLVRDWRWYNGADSTGLPVTFVEFSQPIDAGATPAASGVGKIHARTGDPIVNPADVIHDVLANIVGNDTSESDLDAFRVECARLGLHVAGSIEAVQSIQKQIVEVCESVGAIFCPTMDGLARVWPGGAEDSYASAEASGNVTVSAQASVDLIVNALELRYGWSQGAPTQVLELEAPDSVADFGRRKVEVDARWVGSARVAYEVGVRRLQYQARPVWQIAVEGLGRRLQPGQLLAIDHPISPYTGTATIQAAGFDPGVGLSSVSVQVAIGDTPRVRIVRQSAVHESTQYAGATISTQGSERLLQIKGPEGEPLANARVVLNAQFIRYSDAGGRVSFPVSLMPVGEHTLDISAEGIEFQVRVVVQ